MNARRTTVSPLHTVRALVLNSGFNIGCSRDIKITPIYSRSLERKKFKHFVFNKYFSLVLGLLKSRISEKIN